MPIPILSRLSYWDYERIFLTVIILLFEGILRFCMFFVPYSFLGFLRSKIPFMQQFMPRIFKTEEPKVTEKAALHKDNAERTEEVHQSPPLGLIHDTVLMIEHHGYLAEEHTTITKDGYFLVMHRLSIPNRSFSPNKSTNQNQANMNHHHDADFKQNVKLLNSSSTSSRPVILFMHGCMMSSEIWFALEDSSQCLPLVFYDMGYS